MMSKSRGALQINRRFRGVGRIRRSSGTSNRKLYNRVMDMLEELQARPEYLRAVMDGQRHVLEIYEAYSVHGVYGLPPLDGFASLGSEMEAWLLGAELAATTRQSYASCMGAIVRAGRSDATVGDLPGILAKLRDTAKPVMFNTTRSVARSFLGDTLGRFSDLYRSASNVKPRKATRRPGNPQTPEAARYIAEQLGRYGGMWWTTCCTGMSGGPTGPYLNDWYDIEPDYIRVHGTKKGGRLRCVPRIATPMRTLCGHTKYLNMLKPLGIQPNDGRRTYEAWLEAAQIPPERRRRRMGHGPKDVTELYGDSYEMRELLPLDGKMLRDYIGSDPKAALKMG